jgi:diphthine synthase
MLFLVGVGLDTGDISVKGLNLIKSTKHVCIEQYTTKISMEYLSYLKTESGKDILELSRSDLEERLNNTLSKAKNADLVILFPGDPLIATTHKIILGAAKACNISVRVFHAPSILTAAMGESMLNAYRFGPTTTIPLWTEKYMPTSFLDVILENKRNGQHTLALLDIDPKTGTTISIENAINIIGTAAGQKGVDLTSQKIIALLNLGRTTQKVLYLPLDDLRKKHIREGIASLIFVGRLGFEEEEALKIFT